MIESFAKIAKGTLMRYENLQTSLSSRKNNMPKVSHHNSIYFLSTRDI